MRRKARCAVPLVVLATLALASTASAAELGITVAPGGGATEHGCLASPALLAQTASDPSTPYAVPAGGGVITQWQTLTAGDTPGAAIELVVLRPGSTTVVGTDSETIPNPLPASGVASYTLASPISVQAGDTLGLFAATTVGCYFSGGLIPASDEISAFTDATPPPAAGHTVAFGGSGPSDLANLAATLNQNEDAGVTTTPGPSGAAAGHPTVLSSTVTNAGPAAGAITFTDVVPAGLAIDSALASNGTCSTLGQNVTCAISGLAPGHSSSVNVVVTPGAPGNYANSVSVAVSPPLTDPNSANNSASATLNVGEVFPAQCVVLKLKGIPSGFAKTVERALGCKVKTKNKASSNVPKGDVIGTKPGPGKYAFQKTVTLDVAK